MAGADAGRGEQSAMMAQQHRMQGGVTPPPPSPAPSPASLGSARYLSLPSLFLCLLSVGVECVCVQPQAPSGQQMAPQQQQQQVTSMRSLSPRLQGHARGTDT